MSTHDDDRDAELTVDWPGTQPVAPPPPVADGEATTVVPRMPPPSAAPRPQVTPPLAPRRPTPPPPAPPQVPTWDRPQPQQGWQHPPQPPAAPPGGGWVPPVPPGQYPPGYPPAPGAAPGTRKGPRWGLIGGAAVVVIALVVAAGLYLRGQGASSTPTAAPATTETSTASSTPGSATSSASSAPSTSTAAAADVIAPDALSGLLSSSTDISPIVDNAQMTPGPINKVPFPGNVVAPSNCTGAVVPGAASVYSGSGFTGIANQSLYDSPQDHKVVQSVASFPTEAAAKAFYDQQVNGWQACKFTDFTLTTDDGVSSSATLGVTGIIDDTANVLIFPPSGMPGHQCDHAMTARKNVIVDVRVCANSVGSMGFTLARNIGQTITGQR